VGRLAAFDPSAHRSGPVIVAAAAAIINFHTEPESASKLVQFKRQKTVKKISTNSA
jgi:hypothetical protein